MTTPARAPAQAGFTVVELITVIILVGILGAVAATRFFGRTVFDARTFADSAQSLMRFAQKEAIAQNRPVYVRLNGASVSLCFDSGCATQVLAPGGTNHAATAACANSSTWACEAFPSGVTIAATGLGTLFYFDALGKPFMGTDTPPTTTSTFPAPAAGVATTTALTVTGGGATYKVFVEPETGYVHL